MKDVKQPEIDYPIKLNDAEKNWLETKPFGAFNLDESSRTFRDFATILFLISTRAPQAKTILELGCGPGWLTVFLSKMGYKCTACDISPEMIKVAQRRAKHEDVNADFEVLDIEDNHRSDFVNQFDVVIVYDALHHCQSDQKVIGHIYQYLAKDGLMILSEPNQVHATDQDSKQAVHRFGVTERGLSVSHLKKACRDIGLIDVNRIHASGQNYLPRSESLLDTLKMIFYPILTRFYFGKTRTRIWLTARKISEQRTGSREQ